MMEFDLENPLTSLKEHQADTLPSLFANESHLMPSLTSAFHHSLRHQAISLISQFSYDLDPFVPYLAINYVDRFISKQDIPEEKPWIVRLLVISCLSLAAKIRNINLSLSDLQRDEGFIFDAQSVQKMEVLVLTALNWRMRSITPFSFLYFFISLFEIEDPSRVHALKNRASDILFKSQCEIKLLDYKPSIIAASALLCATHELFPAYFSSFIAAISGCEHVNKENLLKCLGVLRDIVMDSYEGKVDAVSISRKTPISVLDHMKTESESTSSNTPTQERENIKRRKLEFRNNHMLEFSQIQQC